MIRLPALLGLLCASAASPAAGSESYVGYAHDERTGRLVYVERHRQVTFPGARLDTQYLDANGRLIATRSVDYDADPLKPGFELKRPDGATIEGAVHRDGVLEVFRRGETATSLDVARIPADRVDVADAGFVRFVHAHWDDLLAGARLDFDFLVPSRLDTVPLRLQLHTRERVLGEPAVTFRLDLDIPVLRWFVAPIDVSFHAERRELLRYRGISNIPAEGGGNHVVRIDFPPGERRRDVDARVTHAVADGQLTDPSLPERAP